MVTTVLVFSWDAAAAGFEFVVDRGSPSVGPAEREDGSSGILCAHVGRHVKHRTEEYRVHFHTFRSMTACNVLTSGSITNPSEEFTSRHQNLMFSPLKILRTSSCLKRFPLLSLKLM